MRSFSILLLFLLATSSAHADKYNLKERLLKQPLYLRGMWVADDLHFDGTGHALTNSEVASFTLSGIEIFKIDIKSDRLLLTGRRVGLELSGPTPQRVILTLGKGWGKKEEAVTVQIDSPPSGDYTAALDAIFASALEDLIPDLPSYWQPYASQIILHRSPAELSSFAVHRPPSFGGEITEPVIAKSVEPEFNAYAKSMLYQGKVRIQFELGKDARPSNFVVVHPLGLGLDEAAIAAIKQYVFAPSTLHGRPVAVTLTIEANFQIY